MELHIPAGVELQGSHDLVEYPFDLSSKDDIGELPGNPALIIAAHKQNITISGNGIINGRGYFPLNY